MTSNYQLTLHNTREEIRSIREDMDRQISHLSKEIAEKSQSRDWLMKARAALVDYERLVAMELAGAPDR